jgi:hypothetical protein
MLKIDVGSYYYNKCYVHAIMSAFTTHDHMFILDHLLVDVPIDHK